MNSNRPISFYQKLIENILIHIDEDFLARRVDVPLQGAAAEFQFDEDDLLSFGKFLDLIGSFVGHMCLKGCGVQRILTEQQAIAEAIAIIEAGYPGNPQERLDNAFLDVEQYGLQQIFSFFVSSFSASTRGKYVSWILKSSLDPLTWNEKKIVVRLIFHDWQQYLPNHMKDSAPEIFTNQLPELITIINDINQQTRQYFQKDTKPIL